MTQYQTESKPPVDTNHGGSLYVGGGRGDKGRRQEERGEKNSMKN